MHEPESYFESSTDTNVADNSIVTSPPNNALRTGKTTENTIEIVEKYQNNRLNNSEIIAVYDLATLSMNDGHYGEACLFLETIITSRPDYHPALSLLAKCYLHLYQGIGNLDDSINYFRYKLKSQPDNQNLVDAYLSSLHYADEVDCLDLYNEHLRLARHPQNFKKRAPIKLPRKSQKKIRIGYVSSDFKTHAVSYFSSVLFSSYDASKYEIYMYRAQTTCDKITGYFTARSSVQRDISAMDDETASCVIERDHCDLLIDLSGHSAGNRLGIFALKPARTQLTYLGYPNTTGLSTIDYRITDAIADPLGSADNFHSEKLLRLPACFLCYTPPANVPPVSQPPFLKNGFITFGSFNNSNKISDLLLSLWKLILDNTPNARLLIKSSTYMDKQIARRLLIRCRTSGIDTQRLYILPTTVTIEEHLNLYKNVDISLDTYPYNGATTTFESLWMGVPVVTLSGNRHASRVGASVLTHAGLPELVGNTPLHYVTTASTLANDVNILIRLRRELRPTLTDTVCNKEKFMISFENTCDKILL